MLQDSVQFSSSHRTQRYFDRLVAKFGDQYHPGSLSSARHLIVMNWGDRQDDFAIFWSMGGSKGSLARLGGAGERFGDSLCMCGICDLA